MRCLFHRFGRWEDVAMADVVHAQPLNPFPFVKRVIKQQRRCARCNLVQTRSSS